MSPSRSMSAGVSEFHRPVIAASPASSVVSSKRPSRFENSRTGPQSSAARRSIHPSPSVSLHRAALTVVTGSRSSPGGNLCGAIDEADSAVRGVVAQDPARGRHRVAPGDHPAGDEQIQIPVAIEVGGADLTRHRCGIGDRPCRRRGEGGIATVEEELVLMQCRALFELVRAAREVEVEIAIAIGVEEQRGIALAFDIAWEFKKGAPLPRLLKNR